MEKIPALEDAIAKRSMVGIYSVFYTIAHGDPNFSTGKFRRVLEYVKSLRIEGFLQEFDGEEFESEDKWDEDYWALVASSLMDNFCVERINHLEEIGRKVYPLQKDAPVNAAGWASADRTSGNMPPSGYGEGRTSGHNANSASGNVPLAGYNAGRASEHNAERKRSHSNQGLISQERKQKVKDAHNNRKEQSGKGLLGRIFGK